MAEVRVKTTFTLPAIARPARGVGWRFRRREHALDLSMPLPWASKLKFVVLQRIRARWRWKMFDSCPSAAVDIVCGRLVAA